ncbi:MAG: lysophospholipid acyltransferase family protein [Patescibacteria group bacterium]
MIVQIAKIFQMLTYWPIYLGLKICAGYKIEGQENLKGLENKAVIFASNHASYLDGPICAASMPKESFYPNRFFPIRFLALRQYYNWRNPFPFPFNFLTAAYVRINGSIPIDKTGGDLLKALEEAITALKNGDKVWIYPEGSRTKDGNLQKGRRGVAFLQKQTSAPIVPVGITGSHKVCSLKTLFRKNRVSIRIGKPVYSFGGGSLENNVENLMSAISSLIKK